MVRYQETGHDCKLYRDFMEIRRRLGEVLVLGQARLGRFLQFVALKPVILWYDRLSQFTVRLVVFPEQKSLRQ